MSVMFIRRPGAFNLSRHISYRFRLVSISCDPNFTFSIDGHNMTVIEVEGTNVHPLVIDSLEIFVGTCVSSGISCCTHRCQNRPTLFGCCKSISFLSSSGMCSSLTFRFMLTNLLIITVCIIPLELS